MNIEEQLKADIQRARKAHKNKGIPLLYKTPNGDVVRFAKDETEAKTLIESDNRYRLYETVRRKELEKNAKVTKPGQPAKSAPQTQGDKGGSN